MANEKNKKPANETVEAPATATAESTAPTGQQAPQPDPTALSIGDLKNLLQYLTWHPQEVHSKPVKWQA